MAADNDWVCFYVILFDDGGEPEFQVLHRGDRDSCQAMSELAPAVAYGGERLVRGARCVVAKVSL